jgi:2-polyprenyl-3-methyl-5-hydroxy-6-metoxy-1,4-benzoquinol methylase
MRIGTHHFASLAQAITWHRIHADSDAQEVARKIKDGEIVIGRPEEKDSTLVAADSFGRYWVHELPLEAHTTMRFFHKRELHNARAVYQPDLSQVAPWVMYENGTATVRRGDIAAVRHYMGRKGYAEV